MEEGFVRAERTVVRAPESKAIPFRVFPVHTNRRLSSRRDVVTVY